MSTISLPGTVLFPEQLEHIKEYMGILGQGAPREEIMEAPGVAALMGELPEIGFRHGDTLYRISVENPDGVCWGVSRVSLDGTLLPGEAPIPLADDARKHQVQVVLG